MAGITIYTAVGAILRGTTILSTMKSNGKFRVYRSVSRNITNGSRKQDIREKAVRKITEMRSVVTDLTQHNEECIKRREELQKTAENYLKALEASGKSMKDKMSSEDMKNAAAKIEKLRSLVNEFSFHNQGGIRRRMMMQDRAEEYLKALDDYRVRLQAAEQTNIPIERDTRE